jgi:hypothetical protein
MTIAVDAVADRASILLHDKIKSKWTIDELLTWLNDAQLAVVQFRPDAYTQVRNFQLATGTLQAIPSGDLRLISVTRNMGADGLTPGRAIRYVEREELDLSDPDWHTATAAAEVRHYVYDDRIPKQFWCYPQQPGAGQGYIEAVCSAVPPAMTIDGVNGENATSNLGLDDIYLNPILQFVVYRGYSKDAEYAQIGDKADLAFREFLQLLGVQTESDKQFAPRRNQPPRWIPPPEQQKGAF